MKIRGLVIAACVLLVLVGVLYWSNHRKPTEETAKSSADTPPAILRLDEASIKGLELEKKDAEQIVLNRNGSGDWEITRPQKFRADQSAVTGVVSSLSSLNSESLVDEKPSNLKPFGLDNPTLEVDIHAKDVRKLLIGDDTPAGGGVYAMLAGDPRIFTIATYTKTSLDKSLNDLRDKRLLPVNADKISRIELVRKTEDIEFGRNKDEWQIVKPRPLRADSTQVGELVSKLTEAKMDLSGTAGKDAASAYAKAVPVATAKLTDVTGTQELQVRKNKDDYYAKSSVVEGAYKIDAELGKALDKSLDDFRNKKLFDLGYSEPNKIELHNGSKSYFLTRGTAGNDDWWSNGKKMDVENAEVFISDLRNLTASKFVDTGFTNPTIDAIVTTDDGKRTEKIQIAKSGTNYIAKRENEPALYQLDSASVDDLLKAADGLKPASK